MQVLVRDNNVDQALKALKKKMQREGIFREMKLRGHYEKPSEKKAREKAEAIRRARKLARKKAQREGLHSDEAEAHAGRGRAPARRPRRAGPGGAGRRWRRGLAVAVVAAAAVSGASRPVLSVVCPGAGASPRPALWFLNARAIVERSPHSLGEQLGRAPAATKPDRSNAG